MLDENIFKNLFAKKKTKSSDEKLRDRHAAMSDSELKAHAAELKSKIPYAKSQGSLVGSAVHDAWRAAQNEIEKRSRIKAIGEDVPVNAVGGGNIAGLGVDKPGKPGSGEPGVYLKKKKNVVMAPTMRRKSFSDFIKGK